MSILTERPEALEEIQPAEALSLFQATPQDSAILKLVVQDFLAASAFRLPQEDDWKSFDRLYHFQVPPAFWEGTNVPRASLGVPLVFEHIESLLPQVINTIFLEEPPVMLNPNPGTSQQVIRAKTALIKWLLRISKAREQIRLVAKSAMQYDYGILKWGWKKQKKSRPVVKRKVAPTVRAGMGLETGASDDVEIIMQETVESVPFVEALDIRQVYVDPSLRVPDIRLARFVIHQDYITLGDLTELRDLQDYNIPSDAELLKLFFPPKELPPASPSGAGGQASTQTSNPEYNQVFDWNKEFQAPAEEKQETSIDPRLKPLEILEYWNKNVSYTVLQRKLVIRVKKHDWGVVPFLSCPYVDVLNKFGGMGVSRLVGPEQRLQQGMINARLDDLSLSLNGMFFRQRGANASTQQIKTRPGGVIDVDTEKGVVPWDRRPAIPEAYAEVDASDRRAQRRTAASEILVQGAMSAPNSITRTATGVNTLAAGVGSRLEYFITNFLGNLILIPLVYALEEMARLNLKPSEIKSILGKELSEAYEGDVVDVLNSEFEYEVLHSSKLQARKNAMQSAMPLIFRFLLNPQIMSLLQTQGKKLDVGELVNMLFDVSGWSNKNDLIVDLTPEEQQAIQAQAQQQEASQQSQAMQQHASQADLVERRAEATAGKDAIKAVMANLQETGGQ